MHRNNERGIALISVLLIMTMISALLIGFTTMTVSDQRFRFIDRDRNQSFYAASAGLEKLTADLGNLFFQFVAPSAAQVTALTTTPPTIENVAFTKSDNTTGYQIASQFLGSTTISTGPYQGLYTLITQYTMDVTARTPTGGDTHLQRVTETVAIPVFQFGIFSDVDLSFFAGPNFNFGGRVHTNGNLFLSEGGGSTLTLSDKVTAVREIIRQRLQNNALITTAPTHNGTISMTTGGGAFRALAATEGSVVDGVGSALNDPAWTNLSLSTYNANIRNGRTGARTLNLPYINAGGTNIDLSRRPPPNEDTANAILFNERLYTKASIRILLSDTAADITSLPTITAGAPVHLENWPADQPGAYVISAARPPIATSSGPNESTLNAAAAAGANTLTVVNNAGTTSFKPVLTIGAATVTCTGKTADTFTGCTGTPAAANGTPVTSGLAATTLNGVLAAGAATITVQAGGTANFVPAPFWLATVAGAGQPANNLVTCTGYTSTTFTACAGVPAAANGSRFTTNALSTAGTGTIGGWIKIERKSTAGVWTDVTMEILNFGIGGRNLAGEICADPSPNAIVRLQRLRDNQGAVGGNGGGCNYVGTTRSTDFWPNTLFDTREGLVRDVAPATGNVILGGVMHYVAIDAANLANWFAGNGVYAGGSGPGSAFDNGFSVYFSDRRNNRNALSQETGEYGWEDFVNPASATGAPNGTLDVGEDINASGLLDTYGQFPAYNGVANTAPPGAAAPLSTASRPWTELTAAQAKVNRAILFRRALKVFNGATIAPIITGLTFVTENPVYVQGNWNANGGWTDPHAATSVMADSVTLLSNSWNDANGYANPYNVGGRNRNTQTYYRLAIGAGKGMAFPQPPGTDTDFGTDGGAHNFLHYLENGDQAVNYRGSIVTFYYNRQAVGTYKCCDTVYGAPTRNYAFDIDFLDPSRLPPLTPVFRDVNTIGFSQEIRPGR